ncbi:cold-shock protein [Endozoicomonadaceae bacterium StTr2]
MPTGKVKWFNNAKGYGFVLAGEDGTSSEDLFVHYSSINMEGYKTLKAGQSVSFDILQGPKGLHAINITILDHQDAAEPSGAHVTQSSSEPAQTLQPAVEPAAES